MATKKEQKNSLLSHILTRPRVTEKSTRALEANVYTFDVSPSATKIDVQKAIKDIYNVSPVRVNMVNMKKKQVLVRGNKGVKGGGRKAVVFLKKGDSIEFA